MTCNSDVVAAVINHSYHQCKRNDRRHIELKRLKQKIIISYRLKNSRNSFKELKSNFLK